MNGFAKIVALVALTMAMVPSALAQSTSNDATRLSGMLGLEAADKLITLLAKSCPLADAADQAAFDTCRQALFRSEVPPTIFARRILWGAPKGKFAEWRLPLTSFDERVFTALYLPLFMFNGNYQLERKDNESFIIVHVAAAFRNRLAPGQFPYPFWHQPEKWQAYQATNELVFYIDPAEYRVWYALRANNPEQPRLAAKVEAVTPPAFNGEWMWTDEHGKTQPAVTLFDGLLSPENPNRLLLDATYKDFALELRGQSCTSCHAPDNARKMNPLVLLQTPAHALGEISRIQTMVAAGKMPLQEWGAAKPLPEAERLKFLAAAKAFGDAGALALGWEKTKAAPK